MCPTPTCAVRRIPSFANYPPDPLNVTCNAAMAAEAFFRLFVCMDSFSVMKGFSFLPGLLLIASAMAGEPPRGPAAGTVTPSPRKAAPQVPDPRIGSLQLPQVNFRDADIGGALEYLRRKADQASGGTLKLTFVQDLPEDFRPKNELSLDLREVPFIVALNYVGELAGVQFAIEGTRITARAGTAPPPKYAPLSRDAPSNVRGSGALLKPAEPV